MNDLNATTRLDLDWTPANTSASLQKVFEYVMDLADGAINWYAEKKKTKRFFALVFRVMAIVLGAIAVLLPTLGELFAQFVSQNWKPLIGAGGTVVLGGIAGTLLLLDKFYGFSTGWMRYISSELQIRQIQQEFQLDWEREKSSWQGNAPNKDQVFLMMTKCKTFATQVNNCIRSETDAWINEFKSAIRQIDESTKDKSTSKEPVA